MRGINSIQFGGNLTADPEVRYTQQGTAVCNFNLAANRVWGSGNDAKEEVTYLKCTAWKGAAEAIGKHVGKGDPLYVAGYLKQSTWDDKETGAKRHSYELVVQEFTFLGGGGGTGTQSTESDTTYGQHAGQLAEGQVDDDEIPF